VVPQFAVRSGADLGRAIAQARSDAGLTQHELGDLVGLGAPYLSKIESGRTVSLLEHQLRILRRLGARVVVELPGPDRGTDTDAGS
jgi:transcriptional regulator with XRE-family HTH domain